MKQELAFTVFLMSGILALRSYLLLIFELFADGLVFESHSAERVKTWGISRFRLRYVELRSTAFATIKTILTTQLPAFFE